MDEQAAASIPVLSYGRRRLSRRRLFVWAVVLVFVVPVPLLLWSKFGEPVGRHLRLLELQRNLPESLNEPLNETLNEPATETPLSIDRVRVIEWSRFGPLQLPNTHLIRVRSQTGEEQLIVSAGTTNKYLEISVVQPASLFQTQNAVIIRHTPDPVTLLALIRLEAISENGKLKPGWVRMKLKIDNKPATIDVKVEAGKVAEFDPPVFD